MRNIDLIKQPTQLGLIIIGREDEIEVQRTDHAAKSNMYKPDAEVVVYLLK